MLDVSQTEAVKVILNKVTATLKSICSRWSCTKKVWLFSIKASFKDGKFLLFCPTSLKFLSSFNTCLWETVEKFALMISRLGLSSLFLARNTSENPPLPILRMDLNFLSLLTRCLTSRDGLTWGSLARVCGCEEGRMSERATQYLIINSFVSKYIKIKIGERKQA